jgi:hypothetical protein
MPEEEMPGQYGRQDFWLSDRLCCLTQQIAAAALASLVSTFLVFEVVALTFFSHSCEKLLLFFYVVARELR